MRNILIATIFVLCACSPQRSNSAPNTAPSDGSVATFGGGCFWCLETAFEGMKGVHSVVSGYMGGQAEDPTYKQVSSGRTGHAEVVQVRFDPNVVAYSLLLEVFWRNIDPFNGKGQFCDLGSQYRSAIFYHDVEQERVAHAKQVEILRVLQMQTPKIGAEDIKVEISPAASFYVAESYHQDFYKKNPEHYKRYRKGCGRDRRLAEIWGESQNGIEIQALQQDDKKTKD